MNTMRDPETTEVDPNSPKIDFVKLKREWLQDKIRRVIANPHNLSEVVDAINMDWFPLLTIDPSGVAHILIGKRS